MSKILNQAGAVAEQIKNDFGEDLIVQTQLRETADSFSILIQVKGTRLKRGKDGKLRYRIDIEHLLRWVSHYQPVLVCVYDDTTEAVYSFRPRARFSLWGLSTARTKTLSVVLEETDLFSSTSAKDFIWHCRIDYYQRMLSWYQEMQHDVQYLEDKLAKRRLHYIEKEKGVVALDFLKSIGLIQEDAMDPDFVYSIGACSENFAKSNAERRDENLKLSDVFILCVLGQAHRTTGVGLPANLMSYSAHVASTYFSILHPELWHQAEARLAGSGK